METTLPHKFQMIAFAGKQNTFYSQVADGIVMILDNDKSRTISAARKGGKGSFKELYGENENSVIENVLRCVCIVFK